MRDASCLVPFPFFCDHIVLLECFSEYFPANAHTLTDTRREKAGKTLYVADTEAHCIFEVDLEDRNRDEAFAFDRTRSRLEEMCSQEWLRRTRTKK